MSGFPPNASVPSSRSSHDFTDGISQKLKVTELKELLAKHGLTQSGKKDELIQRLVDNGVSAAEEPLVSTSSCRAIPHGD